MKKRDNGFLIKQMSLAKSETLECRKSGENV